ncbi:cytochrome c oxidase assembly protein [Thermoflavimicrobium daqui]|uniref:Cytochrome c oxidase assembly factor CtaG n=1 Tax=Thermoflavimicrobium daqui TaxID=2137476 RepID=A0A364K2E1_9BACL|nr:cytochrome c oxidase assembly protein [Thermoflavimicrobium daqui]RAL22585.1 cytochrome c oxidase assembly factor CtaG [Thermoflavimicrobium daqui]
MSAELFDLFTYTSNWDLTLNLVFIAVAIMYLLVTGPLRHRFPETEPVSGKTKFFFLTGLIVYYFSAGSPLNLLAHELFSMHMLQMSLQYIVLPPLLLLGIPAWMLRPLIKIHWIRAIGKFFTRPLVILFVFNGLLSLYHFPYIFDLIMSSQVLHIVSHTILLFTALCMWWPVVCPVPELDRMKPLLKLGFLVANGVLLTPACALIMFADTVLFDYYASASKYVSVISLRDDEQLGGIIMKIIQEVVYITAIGFVFVQWLRIQRAQDKKEMEELFQQNRVPSPQE